MQLVYCINKFVEHPIAIVLKGAELGVKIRDRRVVGRAFTFHPEDADRKAIKIPIYIYVKLF